MPTNQRVDKETVYIYTHTHIYEKERQREYSTKIHEIHMYGSMQSTWNAWILVLVISSTVPGT